MHYYKKLKENVKDISDNCNWGDYYNHLDLPGGLCFGFAAMWGQACLIGDTKTFYARLELLTKDYSNAHQKLSDIIKGHIALQQKATSYIKKDLAEYTVLYRRALYDHDLVISIRAFLDGLLAYHRPYNTFFEGFEYNIKSQNILKISPWIVNQGLSYRSTYGSALGSVDSPLLEVHNEPFYGSMSEYAEILKSLIVKCIASNYRFYILLGSINHTIAISFENSYLLLYDANNMHNNQVEASKFTANSYGYVLLSDKVFKSFKSNKDVSNSLALNLSIYIHPKYHLSKFEVYKNSAKVLNFIWVKAEIISLLEEYIRINSCNFNKYDNNKVFNDTLKMINCSKNLEDILSYIGKELTLIRSVENSLSKHENYIKSEITKLDERNNYINVMKKIFVIISKNLKRNFGFETYREDLVSKIIKQKRLGYGDLFWIACQNGHMDIVKLLLDHKDINPNIAKGAKRGTPLYIACQNGHINIVKLLLKHRLTDPNISTTDGCVPLHIACENGRKDIVAFLLENGANLDVVTKDNISPLDVASNADHKDIAVLLRMWKTYFGQ
ncbi:ankyrin 1 [Francisella sp. W12-1067]|nr:ankyrin 1 [Francisella sp. W12-1067]